MRLLGNGRFGLRRHLKRVALSVMGTITSVVTREPVVALTFDDGPHPEFTPRLLDLLEGHDARGTFFCLGRFAREHPLIVRRAAEAGHVIGNHSWDHPSFPHISGRERRAQLRACAEALEPYGRPLFRPPYGSQSPASRFDALWLGYRVVAWNVPGHDWSERTADEIADHLVRAIRPGAIVLLHDRFSIAPNRRLFDRTPMVEAVEVVLRTLGDRFRFVTVPELLRYGRPNMAKWHWTADSEWLRTLTPATRTWPRLDFSVPASSP